MKMIDFAYRMVGSRVPRDRNRNLTQFSVVSGLRTAGDSRPYRLAWLVGLLSFSLFANTPPEITNVRASQRENTKLVDIYYDAADADGDLLKVRIEISDNDGLKYSVPAFSLTGDIGEGVAAGKDKHIVWDAGTDWDGEYSDKMRVKVYAIDAQGFPGLEWGNEVPPGGFLMGQDGGAEGSGPSRHVNIPWSYWLSKYEITAEQYCEFLNAAYTAGNVYLDGTTYVRSNGSNAFEGYCNAGVVLCKIGDDQNIRWNVNKFECTNDKTNYPAIVSYYGATAFARFYGYDLPTEAEWEKAARGPDNDDQGEHMKYPWGDSISESYANYLCSQQGYYWTTPSEPTSYMRVGYYDGNQIPVGPDTTNGYGLYDVIGNATEWVRSAYLDTVANYSAQESLKEKFNLPFRYSYSIADCRVRRGRLDDPIYQRAHEDQYEDNVQNNEHGFRVARRYNTTDIMTEVNSSIAFEWSNVTFDNYFYDGDVKCYASSSFAVTNGVKGTKGLICSSAGNDYRSICFYLSSRQICFFTIKVKNTSDVDRQIYLRFESYDSESSTSATYRNSPAITLPANMTEFKSISFDGGPAIYDFYLYITSGVVIDDLEFHTIAE